MVSLLRVTLLLCSLFQLNVASAAAQERRPWRLGEALGSPSWLSLTGSHRTRYSTLGDQFRPGLSRSDEVLELRSLLEVRVTHRSVSLVGELQDSRAYLSDVRGAVSSIVVNTVEPLQAYLGLTRSHVLREGDRLDLRLGRQTLDISSRRLVARNRFRNTIQDFTGLSAHWTGADGSEARAFYVLPVLIQPSNLSSLLDNEIGLDDEDHDLRFWGIYVRRAALWNGADGEMFLYGLHEDDDPGERETRNRTLFTPGARLVRTPSPGSLDFDLEHVVQFGERRATSAADDVDDLDVFAHFHHVAIGYTLDLAASPRIAAELDYASGDADSRDRDHGRFDGLFGPRRADFGPTGIYGPMGRENIVSAGIRLSLAPGARSDGYLSWRANFLEERSDHFARTGLVDPTGSSGDFAGHQIEARLRHDLVPGNLRIELGGALFLQGEFLERAPDANGFGDPAFVYTAVTLTF